MEESTKKNIKLDKSSAISLGLALVIGGSLLVFSVSQENRMTKLETISSIHQSKIHELEGGAGVNNQILVELEYLKEDISEIKESLKSR